MAKTYEELLEQAAIIRDETAAGKNTATRVGGTITDAVDYVKELQDTYAGIHAEAAEAKTEAAAANTKNAEQDGKISSLEAKDATHDTQIAKLEERVLQYLYPKIYQLNEGAGAIVFHGFYKGSASVSDERKTASEDGYSYKVVFKSGSFYLQEISPEGVTVLYSSWAEISLPNNEIIASSESYAQRDCLYYIYAYGEGSTYYYIDSNGVASEQSATYLLRLLANKNAADIAALQGKDAAQDVEIATLHERDTAIDNKISALEAKDIEHNDAIVAIQGKNAEQDGEIATLHERDTAIDNKISALEAKDIEHNAAIVRKATVEYYDHSVTDGPSRINTRAIFKFFGADNNQLFTAPLLGAGDGYPGLLSLKNKIKLDGYADTFPQNPVASSESNGLMSVEDKRKLDSVGGVIDLPWDDDVQGQDGYINNFTERGEYHIHGKRLYDNDGLPIINSGDEHTIDGLMTVLDSSLTNGKKYDVCVTQILRLNNRKGGDGHIFVRTGIAATKLELQRSTASGWSPWEKLMGVFEKNAVSNATDLNEYTSSGMYDGMFVYSPDSQTTVSGLKIENGSTFLMVAVNGYAVAQTGVVPQVTQLLYVMPSGLDGSSGVRNAKLYTRTGIYVASTKTYTWGKFDGLAYASDISKLNGYIQENSGLIQENQVAITANAKEIANVNSTATRAQETADRAQKAANTAQTTADSASSAAAAAQTAAEKAQRTATAANTKITELSLVLGKTGVTSQVQTWTQAADNGYDYVMNGLVMGVIPQANIDLFTSAGAIFNEESGYFELNGLTDISYEEMINIYNAYNPNPWNGQQGMLVVKNTRTFLPANNDIILVTKFNGTRLCYALSDIETINIISNHNEKVQFSNFQLAWFWDLKLKNIQNIIDCSRVGNYSQAFEKCYSLVDVRLWKIIASVSFKDCARLSNSSILYMINNEAATSPTTITLHADVYNRCMANEDILSALEAHTNISLASA